MFLSKLFTNGLNVGLLLWVKKLVDIVEAHFPVKKMFWAQQVVKAIMTLILDMKEPFTIDSHKKRFNCKTVLPIVNFMFFNELTLVLLRSFSLMFFIFIVISTFWLVCPPAFFRCLSNSGTFTKLRTTSFIESRGGGCSDSVSQNQVQVLSIPVLLLAWSQDWICNLQMPP